MKYLLDMSNELRASIKYEAAQREISMNAFIVMAIISFIERTGFGHDKK